MLILLTVLEALFAAALCVGIGMIYLPAGVIAAGVLGVLACEWRSVVVRAGQRSAAAAAKQERVA